MNVNDVSISQVKVEFFPYLNRVPLKFGHEVSNGGELVCVRMQVTDTKGRSAWGYGETPLGAAWSWPSVLSQSRRVERMQAFCLLLQEEWGKVFLSGHPMEIGSLFLETRLTDCLKKENAAYPSEEPMPYLCALVCCSAFDLALYDAYGILHGVKVFDCLNGRYMNRDLSTYYSPEYAGLFAGKYPEEYLVPRNAVPARLAACHLVGGKDHLYPSELTEEDPKDEYPLLLQDWIHRDGLFNLKIKLTGNDAPWDYNRIVEVGRIAIANAVQNLTVDFNCTVTDPAYVNEILDKLKAQEPAIYEMILYVEQPFPYDMEANPIDVHAVANSLLIHSGFRVVVFLATHSLNCHAANSVCRRLTIEGKKVLLADWWAAVGSRSCGVLEDTATGCGHGSEMITSVALALCKELVRMEDALAETPAPALEKVNRWNGTPFKTYGCFRQYCKSGAWGNMSLATAEKGRLLLQRGVEAVSQFIMEALAQ